MSHINFPSKKNGPLRGLAACTRRARCVHAACMLRARGEHSSAIPLREATASVLRVFTISVWAHCEWILFRCACTASVYYASASLLRPQFKPLRAHCDCFYSTASPLRSHFKPLRAHCDCFLFYCEPPASTFQATACTLRLFSILLRAPCDHISSHCVPTATVFYSTASTLRSHFQDQQSDEFTSIK